LVYVAVSICNKGYTNNTWLERNTWTTVLSEE
jgi:hypothetical protein